MDSKKRAKIFLKKLGTKISSVTEVDDVNELRDFYDRALENVPDLDIKSEIETNVGSYFKKFIRFVSNATPVSETKFQAGGLSTVKKKRQKKHEEIEQAVTAVPTRDVVQPERKPMKKNKSNEIPFLYNLYRKRGSKINSDLLEELTKEGQSEIFGHILPKMLSNAESNDLWEQFLGIKSDRKDDSDEVLGKLRQLCCFICGDLDANSLVSVMKLSLKCLEDLFSMIEETKSQQDFDIESIKSYKATIHTLLVQFHLKYCLLEKPSSMEEYPDRMAAVLSLYVDLAILESRMSEKPKKIGRKLTSFVGYLLQGSPDHIFDVLVQITLPEKEDYAVVFPLYRKAILNISSVATCSLYTKCICTGKKCLDLFKDREDAHEIKMKLLALPVPVDFFEWLGVRDSSLLSRIPHEKHSVKFTAYWLGEADESMMSDLLDALSERSEDEGGVEGKLGMADLDQESPENLFFIDTAADVQTSDLVQETFQAVQNLDEEEFDEVVTHPLEESDENEDIGCSDESKGSDDMNSPLEEEMMEEATPNDFGKDYGSVVAETLHSIRKLTELPEKKDHELDFLKQRQKSVDFFDDIAEQSEDETAKPEAQHSALILNGDNSPAYVVNEDSEPEIIGYEPGVEDESSGEMEADESEGDSDCQMLYSDLQYLSNNQLTSKWDSDGSRSPEKTVSVKSAQTKSESSSQKNVITNKLSLQELKTRNIGENVAGTGGTSASGEESRDIPPGSDEPDRGGQCDNKTYDEDALPRIPVINKPENCLPAGRNALHTRTSSSQYRAEGSPDKDEGHKVYGELDLRKSVQEKIQILPKKKISTTTKRCSTEKTGSSSLCLEEKTSTRHRTRSQRSETKADEQSVVASDSPDLLDGSGDKISSPTRGPHRSPNKVLLDVTPGNDVECEVSENRLEFIIDNHPAFAGLDSGSLSASRKEDISSVDEQTDVDMDVRIRTPKLRNQEKSDMSDPKSAMSLKNRLRDVKSMPKLALEGTPTKPRTRGRSSRATLPVKLSHAEKATSPCKRVIDGKSEERGKEQSSDSFDPFSFHSTSSEDEVSDSVLHNRSSYIKVHQRTVTNGQSIFAGVVKPTEDSDSSKPKIAGDEAKFTKIIRTRTSSEKELTPGTLNQKQPSLKDLFSPSPSVGVGRHSLRSNCNGESSSSDRHSTLRKRHSTTDDGANNSNLKASRSKDAESSLTVFPGPPHASRTRGEAQKRRQSEIKEDAIKNTTLSKKRIMEISKNTPVKKTPQRNGLETSTKMVLRASVRKDQAQVASEVSTPSKKGLSDSTRELLQGNQHKDSTPSKRRLTLSRKNTPKTPHKKTR